MRNIHQDQVTVALQHEYVFCHFALGALARAFRYIHCFYLIDVHLCLIRCVPIV